MKKGIELFRELLEKSEELLKEGVEERVKGNDEGVLECYVECTDKVAQCIGIVVSGDVEILGGWDYIGMLGMLATILKELIDGDLDMEMLKVLLDLIRKCKEEAG